MADTRKYKFLRITTHVIATIIAIISILLLLNLVYNNKLFIIENKMTDLSAFKLSNNLLITGLLNLSASFFAGCAISSKINFYMRLFCFYVMLNCLILTLYIIYTWYMAKEEFMTLVNFDRTSKGARNADIRSLFQVKSVKGENIQETAVKKIEEVYTKCANFYLINSVVLLILNFILYAILSLTSDMSQFDFKVRPKVIHSSEEFGLKSGSLRKSNFDRKRLIGNIINGNGSNGSNGSSSGGNSNGSINESLFEGRIIRDTDSGVFINGDINFSQSRINSNLNSNSNSNSNLNNDSSTEDEEI